MHGGESAKISPEANSAWLNQTADAVLAGAAEAEQKAGAHRNREMESTLVDLRILAHLARYHARRSQAALHYQWFKQSGDLTAFDQAITEEGHAIDAWRDLVAAAGDIYSDDLMMGLRSAGLSGHWKDELAELRAGLAELEQQAAAFHPKASPTPVIAHVPIRRLAPGEDLIIRATVSAPQPPRSVEVGWQAPGSVMHWVPMKSTGPMRFQATIPSAAHANEKNLAYCIRATGATDSETTFPEDGRERPIEVLVTTDTQPPDLDHQPVRFAQPGQPLRITARVHDPSGVQWVRVRYRGVSQFEDYHQLALQLDPHSGLFQTVIPGDQISPRWDFMYFLEAMDNRGNGRIYPNLEKETPYVIVKLHEAKTAARPATRE